MTGQDVQDARVRALVDGFGYYVSTFDRLAPRPTGALARHRETIKLRRELGTATAAVADGQFVAGLRRTLTAWRIGSRGSSIVPRTEFADALRAVAAKLTALEQLTIDGELPTDIAHQLWAVMDVLGVVTNKAKLVAGTKTLHHLLPELVVPVDRGWTGTFFGIKSHGWQSAQRRTYDRIHTQFAHIARQVDLARYVTADGWHTSRTKVLDNALIGFCQTELSRDAAPLNMISFGVAGYPPARNAMAHARHPHASRVRSLLESAARALAAGRFVPVADAPVGLDLVVRVPAEQPERGSEYFDGVAGVLADKSAWDLPSHLADLATVSLYDNERQIKEIQYREVRADDASYTVTIRRS